MSTEASAPTRLGGARLSRRAVNVVAALLFLTLPLTVSLDFFSGSGYYALGGSVKAEDFLILYNAGKLTNEGRAVDAYNYRLFLTSINEQIGRPLPDPVSTPEFATVWPVYLYSPPVTLVFALLARLPYWGALAVWLGASLLALLLALKLLRDSLPFLQRYPYRLPAMFALGFWPVNIVFTNGQNSAFTFLVYASAFFLTQPRFGLRYDWAAGAVAGALALQKPQLLAGILVVWLLTWRWRALLGLAAATAAACALTLLVLPPATFEAWLGNLLAFSSAAPDAPRPETDVTVQSLLRMALPFAKEAASVLYYLFAAAALGLLAAAVRRLAGAPISDTRKHLWLYALAALFSIASPNYLLIYDLTLLLLPIIILLALYKGVDAEVYERLKVVAALVYAGMVVFHFVGIYTHVQLAGLVSLGFVAYAGSLLYRELTRSAKRETAPGPRPGRLSSS